MGWKGVDLDGTLAHYESGQYPEIGEPIPAMMDRVQKWVADGEWVKIMTARAAHGAEDVLRVRQWLEKHGLEDLEVTCIKDADMDELWDDKAVQVIPNTGECIMDEEEQVNEARTLRWIKNKKKPIAADPQTFELVASLAKQKPDPLGETYGDDLQQESFSLFKTLERERLEE